MRTILAGRIIGTMADLKAIQRRVKKFSDMWLEVDELPISANKQILANEALTYTDEASGQIKCISVACSYLTLQNAVYCSRPLFDIKLFAGKMSDEDKQTIAIATDYLEQVQLVFKRLKNRPMDEDGRAALFKISDDYKNLRFSED